MAYKKALSKRTIGIKPFPNLGSHHNDDFLYEIIGSTLKANLIQLMWVRNLARKNHLAVDELETAIQLLHEEVENIDQDGKWWDQHYGS